MEDSKREQLRNKLFNNENEYASKELFQSHLLSQYSMYVESADRVSSKRQTVNSFFLTINTVIIGLMAHVQSGIDSSTHQYWLIGFSGMALSFLWFSIILSHKKLNSAKFAVIHEIESKLPLSPYDAEWEYVERGENSKLYKPFTHIEIGIPWIFFILHFVTFCTTFPWSIICSSCQQ